MLICAHHGKKNESSLSHRGYFGGGNAVAGDTNRIDAIQFSNEASLSVVAALTMARSYLGAVHSLERGYWAGGSNDTTEIDGIRFADEAAINPAAVLQLGRGELCGVHSSTKGYWAGGWAPTSLIDGINFSTEAGFLHTATLAPIWYGSPYNGYVTTLADMAGTNSSTVGYLLGGYLLSTVPHKDVRGLNFATGACWGLTSAATGSTMYCHTGVSTETASFTTGGDTRSSVMQKMVHQSEVCTELGAQLSGTGSWMGGVNNLARGYFGGGANKASTVDGFQFDTETALGYVSATLSLGRAALAGVNSGGFL